MSKNFSTSDATSAGQLHHVLAGTQYVPNDTVMRVEDIMKYPSIDSLFGERYYKVLFLEGKQQIGHWVLLTHLRDADLEYFDSGGNKPPAIVQEWAGKVGVKNILFSTTVLQSPDSYNCGRFVLARISSQPTLLQTFIDVLSSSTSFSPDEFVGYLFNVDSE